MIPKMLHGWLRYLFEAHCAPAPSFAPARHHASDTYIRNIELDSRNSNRGISVNKNAKYHPKSSVAQRTFARQKSFNFHINIVYRYFVLEKMSQVDERNSWYLTFLNNFVNTLQKNPKIAIDESNQKCKSRHSPFSKKM